MSTPTRDDAWNLVTEWIAEDSLRKHVLGVEAAMRAYARRDGEDEELWAITGLVHDLDYERYPDLETGHPRHALEVLREAGYPQEVVDAVAGHAEFLGVPRETQMAKTLFAVDELSGFIAACALVKEDQVIPPRSIVVGVPGKVVGQVTDAQWAEAEARALRYHALAERHARGAV